MAPKCFKYTGLTWLITVCISPLLYLLTGAVLDGLDFSDETRVDSLQGWWLWQIVAGLIFSILSFFIVFVLTATYCDRLTRHRTRFYAIFLTTMLFTVVNVWLVIYGLENVVAPWFLQREVFSYAICAAWSMLYFKNLVLPPPEI